MERMIGGDLPVRVKAWDGSEAGPPGAPAVVVRSRRALRRLIWQPNELGLGRAYVAGDLGFEGDVFELLRAGALTGRRIGVWYYDAGHAYEQQINGLRLVEPYLAERALLIVDDADWERVASATRNYVAAQPRARPLLDLAGNDRGSPHWWYGVQLLGWDGG
jgi:hypothetical protein